MVLWLNKAQQDPLTYPYIRSGAIQIKHLAVDRDPGSGGQGLGLRFENLAVVDQGVVHLYLVSAGLLEEPLMKDTCPSGKGASPRPGDRRLRDRLSPAHWESFDASDASLLLGKELVLDDQSCTDDQDQPDQRS